MEIIFMEPYDDRSWIIQFDGIWDKTLLQPHVELRTQADIDAGYKNTAYHSMTQQRRYKLVELHRDKDSIVWYVSELRKGLQGPEDKKTSFTVHRGEKAISDYLPMIDDKKSYDD